MTDLNFGLIDYIDSRLEKHKDKLGPLHRPLTILLGSVIFLVLLTTIIGLPMFALDDVNYVVLAQFILIVIYFMLLLTINQNVFDRFAFSLAVFIVMTAGPVMISTAAWLKYLTPVDEQVASMLSERNVIEVFLYSFLRGLGNVAWALPMLFMFFTFYPRFRMAGDSCIQKRLVHTCRTALILQILIVILVPWLDGASKGVADLADGLGVLGDQIRTFQRGYLIFMAAYLLAGFAAIITARYLSNGDDKRWLWVVVTGLVACQLFYALASYNDHQIALRYPGSRTTADFVSAYESDTGDVVFTNPRLHNISEAKYGGVITYATCEGKSGEFTFKVERREDFESRYSEVNMANLRAHELDKFFCWLE